MSPACVVRFGPQGRRGAAEGHAPHGREKDEVRTYLEDQTGESVIHGEKVASERIVPARHDIWSQLWLRGRRPLP